MSKFQIIVNSEQRKKSLFLCYLLPIICYLNRGHFLGITLDKSRKFAIRIYNLYKYLCEEKRNMYWQNNYCALARL
jgi:hypothetical protein